MILMLVLGLYPQILSGLVSGAITQWAAGVRF
jgi:hypothetical protein